MVAISRFPKTWIANQISALADELDAWSTKYRTDVLPENYGAVTDAQYRIADNRMYALEDLAQRLGEIALELQALP